MIHFKLGQDELKLPVGWSEVTVEQFLQLRAISTENDIIKILSILSGISYEKWSELKLANFEKAVDDIISTLSWMSDIPDFKSLPMPKKYMLADKLIDIPDDLKLETLGQRFIFEREIFPCIERTGDVIEVIDKAIAIYIQPRVTGKDFDANKAIMADVESKVRASFIFEAYPIASFFFNNYMRWLSKKEKSSSKVETQKS